MQNIAYKYKLLPNKEQTQKLAQMAGSGRWLWNYMLDLNKKTYEKEKKFVFAYDMANLLPDLKQEHNWLKEVPSQALQQRCIDLDTAIKRVWTSSFGFPKFKSKHRSVDGFRIPQTNNHIKITEMHITIPKLGKVKWKYHRPIVGKVKSISVTKDINSWYVSVLCEISDVTPKTEIDKTKTIGIDLGVSHFATLSDGTKIDSPGYLKQKLYKLKKYQRRLRNKQKKSNNYQKHCDRIAKIHQKVRYQRCDFLHKTSKKLVNQYDVICTEKLNIKQLLEKKQLSRSIADQGWAIFINQLEYKAKLQGKHLTKIDMYLPSTKTCFTCKSIRQMKLSDRVYICENSTCDDYLKTKDRDINAAMNIHFWGLMAMHGISFQNTPGTGEINACGDTLSPNNQAYDWHLDVSMKQEAAIALASQ